MRILNIVGVAGLALALSGCLSAPFEPPVGEIFSKFSAPLSTEGNWKQGSKVGTGEVISILGIVSVGDCSLHSAMQNGGIKDAYYADYDYFNVLGIYQKATIKVVGD